MPALYVPGAILPVTTSPAVIHPEGSPQADMTSEPYRILIEQSPDGMLIAQDDVITFANAAAARLCGAANEHALIGRPLLEIFAPTGTSGRAIRTQRFARAAAGEHVAPFEEQLVQPDGGACDVEIAVTRLALLDGSVAGHHARDAGDLRAQARRIRACAKARSA